MYQEILVAYPAVPRVFGSYEEVTDAFKGISGFAKVVSVASGSFKGSQKRFRRS